MHVTADTEDDRR